MVVQYNEDTGVFTFQDNGFFSFIRRILGTGDEQVYEGDLSINKINELKEKGNKTTLTDHDIDMLYKFAGYKGGKDEFQNTPLKDLFKLNRNDLKMGNLMPLAYGKQKINNNEKFTAQYHYDYKGDSYFKKVVAIIMWIGLFVLSGILIKNLIK